MKEQLSQSLGNLTLIVAKYKISKPDGSPLTGEEFSQLFIDLKILKEYIDSDERLQKVIASEEQV